MITYWEIGIWLTRIVSSPSSRVTFDPPEEKQGEPGISWHITDGE